MRALRAFHTCKKQPVGASHAWSLEYHIAKEPISGIPTRGYDDESELFGSDLISVRPSPNVVSPPSARVLAITIVREPHSWYASQWRAPEGAVWPARKHGQDNFSEFVSVLGAGWQYRSLLKESGLNSSSVLVGAAARASAIGAADGARPARLARMLLSVFDVVGVTNRLETTMFFICEAVGLALCPALPPRRPTGTSPPSNWASWQPYSPTINGSARQMIETYAAVDFALHRHASKRLSEAVEALPHAARASHRRHVSDVRLASAQRVPCTNWLRPGTVKWGRRKRGRGSIGMDMHMCHREHRNNASVLRALGIDPACAGFE